jgi:hypothetical protein
MTDKDKYTVALYKEPLEFWDNQPDAERNDHCWEEKRKSEGRLVALIFLAVAINTVAAFCLVWRFW